MMRFDSRERGVRSTLQRLAIVGVTALLAACAAGVSGAQDPEDAALAARVAAAIAGASDLPQNSLAVAADGGVVQISGSVACADCGGMLTPGGIQTIQQTLGAVVRAVPGVERVEFDLSYQ
jgi:hypothetical protein